MSHLSSSQPTLSIRDHFVNDCNVLQLICLSSGTVKDLRKDFLRWSGCYTQIHAEPDAYYTHLYGLTRDELHYIRSERFLWRGFPWGDFKYVEGKGKQAIGAVQNETSRFGGAR
jgi:hypothetical protein